MTKRIRSLAALISRHGLLVLAGFLFIFIPLYPKIPLFSPIESYIVRVRLEDVFVAVAGLVWLIQIVRKKIPWRTPLTFLIGGYLLVGGLSVVSALWLVHSIPFETRHIGKSLLHLFRYAEYFLLFFISYAAGLSLKVEDRSRAVITTIAVLVTSLFVYSIGQMFFTWPVFSTMNREYSKGVALQLVNESARLQATFAGHYDLGAYLVVVLPFLLAALFTLKKRSVRVGLASVYALGVWLVVMTASRSSFLGFLAGAGVVTLVAALKQPSWLMSLRWSSIRLSFVAGLTVLMTVFFGSNVATLFLHAGGVDSQVSKVLAGVSRTPLAQLLKIDQSESEKSTVISQHVLPRPKEQPEPIEVSEAAQEWALVSASGQRIVIDSRQQPALSECAQKRGLSLCIRFDSLWPQAWKGFLRSPIIGTGYATLNKKDLYHFTDADGTDNNFLRVIGETGVLGFVTFFGIIGYGCWRVLRQLVEQGSVKLQKKLWLGASTAAGAQKHTQLDVKDILPLGYLGAVAGLLINALLIDVFASSKVAYAFWAITGIVMVGTIKKIPSAVTQLPKLTIKNLTVAITMFLVMTVGFGLISWKYFSTPFSEIADFLSDTPQYPPLRFILMGDTGAASPAQFEVAQAISTHCQIASSCEAVYLLGDLIYEEGVSSVDDPQLQTKLAEPYAELDLPIFLGLGNHDYLGCTDCIQEFAAGSEQFVMPSRYYLQQYGPLVTVFMIDTEQFDAEQQQWLAERLAASESIWKIVVGHRPLVTAESTKQGENWFGKAELEEILCEHADFYVAGHAHLLEDAGDLECGLRQLVSGAGGAYPRDAISEPESEFVYSGNGFLAIEVNDLRGTYFFFDQNGRELFRREVEAPAVETPAP